MIFGITLKKFALLQSKGENAKASKRTIRLIEKATKKKFQTVDLNEISFSDFVDLERFVSELKMIIQN